MKNKKYLLLVIAVILLIPLFFAIRSQAGQTASANTSPVLGSSVPPTRMVVNPAIATATPTFVLPTTAPGVANGKEPPPCTFPLAQIKTVASAPDNYTFSEPKVVLTASKGNYYHIIQWLPDNQQVLITEDLLGNYVIKFNTVAQQSISLFNAVTGVLKVYAIRPGSWEPPAWNPALNAIVYPALNYTNIDKVHGSTFTNQVWVSHGESNTVQKLADNLSQFPFGVKPDGSKIIFRSDNKINGFDKSLKSVPSVSFDPTQWDYAKDRRNSDPVSFQMAWQPDTSLAFLCSEGNGDGGYTFILDTDTGRVCELNLGGMAFEAHWSSDGHYLAFVRSVKYTYPTFSEDLTVMDTVTGNLKVLSVIPPGAYGEQHFAHDFAWGPDNRHIVVIGGIYTSPDIPEQTGLYLVDMVSERSIKIDSRYIYEKMQNSIAWSADGSKLAIGCPTNGVDQICLISVQHGIGH